MDVPLSDIFDGLVLRALNCKRCKKVLPIAADDVESMQGMKVVHHKKDWDHYSAWHEVIQGGTNKIAIWHVSDQGQISVPLGENNIILRIRKAGPMGSMPVNGLRMIPVEEDDEK